jgi:hypothetical protein
MERGIEGERDGAMEGGREEWRGKERHTNRVTQREVFSCDSTKE